MSPSACHIFGRILWGSSFLSRVWTGRTGHDSSHQGSEAETIICWKTQLICRGSESSNIFGGGYVNRAFHWPHVSWIIHLWTAELGPKGIVHSSKQKLLGEEETFLLAGPSRGHRFERWIIWKCAHFAAFVHILDTYWKRPWHTQAPAVPVDSLMKEENGPRFSKSSKF